MDEPRPLRRSQFAMVVVLVSLNDTFDRKSLVVPFAPEVLKLGRQTNSKTAAMPDNGFFDSRVLSRQHAEIWAERDTGKVFIKDCKSSNGTYINHKRLSTENTESEPFELQKNDLIDLGIDISSDDNSSLVYKKISARVERTSMMPLHVVPNASTSTPQQPKLSRTSSLSTIKGNDDEYIASIFGVQSASLESMTLNHSKTSTNGLSLRQDVVSNLEFELAAKRLLSEIRMVRTDLAKLQSVRELLEDIEKRQSLGSSVSITALRAENDRFRSENNALAEQLSKSPASASAQGPLGPQQQAIKVKEPQFRPSAINNMVLLMITNVVMVIAGVGIMFIFNPPTW